MAMRTLLVDPVRPPGCPLADGALRVGYGLTLVTHGLPKMFATAHGSMADPMAASARLIETRLGLPFAPQLALAVAFLEAIGGVLMALGLGTRLVALAFVLEMIGICFALGPTYPWIDRGIEYPIILGLIGSWLIVRGGGRFSLDHSLFRHP